VSAAVDLWVRACSPTKDLHVSFSVLA
jgi:hypothetical protein